MLFFDKRILHGRFNCDSRKEAEQPKKAIYSSKALKTVRMHFRLLFRPASRVGASFASGPFTPLKKGTSKIKPNK